MHQVATYTENRLDLLRARLDSVRIECCGSDNEPPFVARVLDLEEEVRTLEAELAADQPVVAS